MRGMLISRYEVNAATANNTDFIDTINRVQTTSKRCNQRKNNKLSQPLQEKISTRMRETFNLISQRIIRIKLLNFVKIMINKLNSHKSGRQSAIPAIFQIFKSLQRLLHGWIFAIQQLIALKPVKGEVNIDPHF